jgi:hypothetical protein
LVNNVDKSGRKCFGFQLSQTFQRFPYDGAVRGRREKGVGNHVDPCTIQRKDEVTTSLCEAAAIVEQRRHDHRECIAGHQRWSGWV